MTTGYNVVDSCVLFFPFFLILFTSSRTSALSLFACSFLFSFILALYLFLVVKQRADFRSNDSGSCLSSAFRVSSQRDIHIFKMLSFICFLFTKSNLALTFSSFLWCITDDQSNCASVRAHVSIVSREDVISTRQGMQRKCVSSCPFLWSSIKFTPSYSSIQIDWYGFFLRNFVLKRSNNPRNSTIPCVPI